MRFFIYGTYEDGTSAFDVFYRINGEILEKEKINDTIKPGERMYDTSDERQSGRLNIGLENLDGIDEKCKEFGREMPTEMRLHYDVESNKLRAKYRYDRVFSDDMDLLPGDLFDAWLQSIANGEPALV